MVPRRGRGPPSRLAGRCMRAPWGLSPGGACPAGTGVAWELSHSMTASNSPRASEPRWESGAAKGGVSPSPPSRYGGPAGPSYAPARGLARTPLAASPCQGRCVPPCFPFSPLGINPPGLVPPLLRPHATMPPEDPTPPQTGRSPHFRHCHSPRRWVLQLARLIGLWLTLITMLLING